MAQLVAHMHGVHGVAGSSPVTPTRCSHGNRVYERSKEFCFALDDTNEAKSLATNKPRSKRLWVSRYRIFMKCKRDPAPRDKSPYPDADRVQACPAASVAIHAGSRYPDPRFLRNKKTADTLYWNVLVLLPIAVRHDGRVFGSCHEICLRSVGALN